MLRAGRIGLGTGEDVRVKVRVKVRPENPELTFF